MIKRVYDSRSIANYLIGKAAEAGRNLTALQLMKLVYIAHGFTLGIFARPLLEDDVEAWQYGPVMRRIYKQLPGGQQPVGHLVGIESAQLDAEEKQIVDDVYRLYGNLSGLYLSNLTHANGSPWRMTWDTYGKNAVIPQDLIQAHYTAIIESARQATAAGQQYYIKAL